MKPKLAHLFLVRDNLNHEEIWQSFFKGHEGQYNIYAHAKWPQQITSRLMQKHLISRHCETEHTKFSLVEAELEILKAAVQDESNQFFLLHSESCIPIRSFSIIYEQLFALKRSWICYSKQNINRRPKAGVSKEHFYKSSQFFCLTRSHAQIVLNYLDISCWKDCSCPDEHYIPTILSMHGCLHECLQRDLTFADWRRVSISPATFHSMALGDLKLLQHSSSFFARKFAPDSDISNYLPMEFY
jgi:hypothetical protein